MTDEPSWGGETEFVMRRAGWFPGRRVDVSGWATGLRDGKGLEMHPAAAEFLAEFGGLVVSVEDLGPGVDYARTPFHLDPTEGTTLRSYFPGVEERARGCLYTVGDASDGEAELAMDEASDVFMLFVPKYVYLGRGWIALASMIEGRDYASPSTKPAMSSSCSSPSSSTSGANG